MPILSSSITTIPKQIIHQARSPMSNLIQRVLVAIIAIPVVLFIVLYKPVAFFMLAVILAGLTVHEYYGLAKAKGYRPQVGLGIALTIFITLSFGKFRIQS